MQIRPDIVARDREARLDLARAGRDFRAELGASVVLIKAFTIEATQLAAEQGKKIADVTEEFTELQRTRMAEDAATYAAALREALDAAGKEIAQSLAASIKTASKTTETEVRASLASLAAAVEAFSRAEATAIEERRRQDAETTEMAGAALSRAAGLVAQTETLAARLGAALDAISGELRDGAAALVEARAALAREEALRSSLIRDTDGEHGASGRDSGTDLDHDGAASRRSPAPDRASLGGLLTGFGLGRR